MTLRQEVVQVMGYDPATQTQADKKPDFCSDREVFPQNKQEFEDLWMYHFAPRYGSV